MSCMLVSSENPLPAFWNVITITEININTAPKYNHSNNFIHKKIIIKSYENFILRFPLVFIQICKT